MSVLVGALSWSLDSLLFVFGASSKQRRLRKRLQSSMRRLDALPAEIATSRRAVSATLELLQ